MISEEAQVVADVYDTIDPPDKTILLRQSLELMIKHNAQADFKESSMSIYDKMADTYAEDLGPDGNGD